MRVSSPPRPIANSPVARVLVASSAMLAFISFWRVAAIVLNDMGSLAFYAGAISEHFIGKTAPVVCAGNHVACRHRCRTLYRELWDVRARRRVPGRKRSDGQHAGEVLSLGNGVRRTTGIRMYIED